VVIGSGIDFDMVGNGFCVVLVVCHVAVFSIVGSGSAMIAVVGMSIFFSVAVSSSGVVFDIVSGGSFVMIPAGSGAIFGGVSGVFVLPGSGFSMLVNGNCSFFGVGGFGILVQFRIVIVTFFTGSGGATKMSRHEISISFSVETGSKPIMPAERRGLVNPPEKTRPLFDR